MHTLRSFSVLTLAVTLAAPVLAEDLVPMLVPQQIVKVTFTGEIHTAEDQRLMTGGTTLGYLRKDGWQDVWKGASKYLAKKSGKSPIYFYPGYLRGKGKKSVHALGVLTLEFADGTSAKVALPELTNDGQGNLTDSTGRAIPKKPATVNLYLGANGNSYYDEEGTRLAASLKTYGIKVVLQPQRNIFIRLLRRRQITSATVTGKFDTEAKPQIQTSGTEMGSFTSNGWQDAWKRIHPNIFRYDPPAMSLNPRTNRTLSRKIVHTPGIMTLTFADGTTTQVALPDLTIDKKGNAVDGAGQPVPAMRFGLRLYLAANGNSYYDEATTKLAASLKEAKQKKTTSKKPDPHVAKPPKLPVKTGPSLRTWKTATGTYSIKARFVRLEGGVVTLQRESGKTLTVPIAKLSKIDQAYAKTRAGAK